MKRSIEATGWILVAFTTFLLVLPGFMKQSSDVRRVPSTLRVPHIGQLGSNLCWAACTEMVSRYYNSINDSAELITECEATQKITRLTLPCSPWTRADSVLNVQASPNIVLPPWYSYQSFTFDPTRTHKVHPKFENRALPFDSLAFEIAQGRPVIFSWNWRGIVAENKDTAKNGFHYLVAEGIPHSQYEKWQWVAVNDPEPVGHGAHRLMLYWEYAGLYPSAAPDGRGLKSVYSPDFLFYYHSGDIYHITPIF